MWPATVMDKLELRVPTASEWKTVAVFLDDNVTTPYKIIRMTGEPAPMTTLGFAGQIFGINDVEEHIDGGFSAFVSRVAPIMKN